VAARGCEPGLAVSAAEGARATGAWVAAELEVIYGAFYDPKNGDCVRLWGGVAADDVAAAGLGAV